MAVAFNEVDYLLVSHVIPEPVRADYYELVLLIVEWLVIALG